MPVPLAAIALLLVVAGGSSPRHEGEYSELLSEGVACLRTLDFGCADTALSAAAARVPDEAREKAKLALVTARAKIGLGKPAQAAELLSRPLMRHLPSVLAEALAFERGRALVLAKAPGAREALASFIQRFPKSRHADEIRLLAAEAARAAGDFTEAVRLAREVRQSKGSIGRKAEATLLLASLSAEPTRSELLTEVFVDMPHTLAAERTGLQEAGLSKPQLQARASAFFEAMDYDAAMRIEESLWQAGERSPDRALRLARLHLIHVRDDARKAIQYLDIAEKGGAISRPDALFFRARAHAKLEEYDASTRLFRQYLEENPNGEKRPEALYYLAWLPYDHDEYEKALPEMDRFLAEVKQHELRSYILWAKGWSLYRLKRFSESIDVFDAMKKLGNCLVAGKAMYWGGMAHRARGNEAEAVRWMQQVVKTYPLTWYAVLGARRLHEWKGTPLPVWMIGPSPGLPEPKPVWPAKGLKPALANQMQKVKDFSDVGETDRARALYSSVARDVEKAVPPRDLPLFLATIYEATEDYNASYQRGTKEFSKVLDDIPTKETAAMWRVAYPRAHRSLIRVLGRRFGFPELWAYAIMRQESRYSPRQVSHTAALGIMQMIPKTAKIVSKVLGVPFEVETFFEPGRNLLFCTWYLAALLKDFKGQIVFASAAYNGGAPAIKRFLAEHRGLPLDEMVEEIPYNESRNYCRKVAEHLIRYAYLHLPAAKRKALYSRIFPDKVDYDIGNAVDY